MTSTAASLKNSARRFSVILGVATLFALFFATKDSFGQRAMGIQITWGKNLWWKGMEWYAWALFSPFIFRVCRKFDFSGGLSRMISGQLAWAIVFSLLHSCVVTTGAWIEAQVIHTGLSVGRLFEIILASYFHEDVLTYAGIVSAWYALDYYRQLRERERRAVELEKNLAKARLHALKMQLHPHFLFNTLNGIAALNYENPKAANRMLARLSELLRMTLEDDSAPEVPLRQELEFNRRYLELEQIRLGDRLTVKLEVAPETLAAAVPNLLLQPLVENAIRHGIAPYSAGGEVSIHAHRKNGTLCLCVADNGPGLTGEKGAPDGSGVGLRNTRARLRQLYGNAHRFELTNAERGGLVVEIDIPFHADENRDAQFQVAYEDTNAHH
jgi:signal transduction histidine kinase